MKLDRNQTPDGTGKYTLILNRKIADAPPAARHEIADALKILAGHGVLDDGSDPEKEFFVLRLKDAHAGPALLGYSTHASKYGDREFAAEVGTLAAASFRHAARCLPS